ncbi:MAG: tetratricopeptide repeat protein [Gemmataceae bacterium]|nr:tetratricopeptide repeat protein [Gemmataceae bacterium]MDW8264114.1 tetratricopeptide repeat protein [Gemmataceae bacterium]
MRRMPGWLALAALLGVGLRASAQVLVGPVVPPWAGVRVGVVGPRGAVGVAVGGFYGFPTWWSGSWSYTSVSIYTPPTVVVPVVVNVPPAEPAARVADRQPLIADPLVIRPRAPAEAGAAAPEAPLPGELAGGFRPIAPGERWQAGQAAAQPPRPNRPVPPLPQPRQPDPDPKVEHAWQVALGRQAFAAREYGRAAARFRRAVELDPHEPTAYFLLAQAEFAVGRYAEAVAAIHAGMRLQPDWPNAPFRSRDLYGPHGADLDEQAQRLRQALAEHANDPVLLFLYAYQLWFDGRPEEARPLFRRCLPLVADPLIIDRFLQARVPPLLAGR